MMTSRKITALPFDTSSLRGSLKLDEPMARHTSWRVGGPAEYFYLPADCEDVVQLLKCVPEDMPIHWVGLGSNLLVRDGGVSGLVIKTTKALAEIKLLSDTRFYAESGVSCAKVAKTSVARGLGGAEFLAGVPGSFGGALAMNAGAFGGETWPLVAEIHCVDRGGNLKIFGQAEISWSYRRVNLPEGFAVLAGVLVLQQSDDLSAGKASIRALLEKRSASQPIQSANAGSTFKNPDGDFAARIIEHVGLKGYATGGACFSDVHANFIINRGKATAADIEALMSLAQLRAEQEFGVELEPEVRIIGKTR